MSGAIELPIVACPWDGWTCGCGEYWSPAKLKCEDCGHEAPEQMERGARPQATAADRERPPP